MAFKSINQLKKIGAIAFFSFFIQGTVISQSCDSLEIEAGTHLITSDTTFSCDDPFKTFLICSGVTVTFADNSCFNTFYLEPGATLIFDTTFSYGYSEVYAQQGSNVDANLKQIMDLYYEVGANLIDTSTTSGNMSPINLYECSSMSFDYSLSGSCPGMTDDCTNILLPASTIIISSDTTFTCGTPFDQSFLICAGVTVNYTDNSCFYNFYLEPGATLIYDTTFSYGYSTVYAQSLSTVDANFQQIMNIHYATGSNLIDTSTVGFPQSPINLFDCASMTFDYSLSGTCASSLAIETQKNESGSIQIYPNPVTNAFSISHNGSVSHIAVYDLSGKIISTQSATQNLIDVSTLDNGIYFVSMYNAEGDFITTVKIIKAD